jgi:hypothetical protein
MAKGHTLFALTSLFALVACASTNVEDMSAADGTPEHLLTCRSSDDCARKASRVCRGGYAVRESNGDDSPGPTTNYLRDGRVVSTSSDATQELVECNKDQPAPSAAGPDAPEPREDSRVCMAAYAFADGFAQYWAAHAPLATRLHDLPQRRDFVVTCQSLPEPIQRCMHDKFRQVHAEACDAVLARLGDRERAKIDGLFLAAPAAKAAPPTVDGDGATRSL